MPDFSIYAPNAELEAHKPERVHPPVDLVPSWIEVYRYWDNEHGTQAWIYCFRIGNKFANCIISPESLKSDTALRLFYRDAMAQIIIALTFGDENKGFRKALKVHWCRRSEELMREIKEAASAGAR